MARDDEETPWTRQLLVTAGVLLAVALVIGAIVGAVAVGAAKVSGLGDTRATADASPTLVVPSGRPTTDLDTYPDPSASPSASPSAGGSASAGPSTAPKQIILRATPLKVGANQRITLTGGYPNHEGVRLQVQRFENGGWVDFPVDAQVSGGTFSTYITTGRTGVSRLRVIDKAAAPGRGTSAAVRVTVG